MQSQISRSCTQPSDAYNLMFKFTSIAFQQLKTTFFFLIVKINQPKQPQPKYRLSQFLPCNTTNYLEILAQY